MADRKAKTKATPRKAAKPAAKKAGARPAKKAARSQAGAKARPPAPARSPPRPTEPTAPPVVADVAEDSPAAWIAEQPGAEASRPAPPSPASRSLLPPPPQSPAASSSPSAQGWLPAKPAPVGFDPATGAWLPAAPAAAAVPPAELAPDAPKKDSVGYVLWTVLLWIDLVVLGISALASIAFGVILLFAPDSSSAEWIRSYLEGGSESDLVANTLVGFVAFGVIPLLWVLGTRREPKEGTKRFLHLHEPAKGILRGILLTIPLLIAVALLVTLYTVATEGVDGLTGGEEANPAVQAILDNLTWPIAILVALCAGIGEEIFFRGLLQRYLGVWGQAVLFGLAHATGGYLPQIVFALGLGVLFGYLIKRGWSLWSLITAHVLYDFTLLALALVAPEVG